MLEIVGDASPQIRRHQKQDQAERSFLPRESSVDFVWRHLALDIRSAVSDQLAYGDVEAVAKAVIRRLIYAPKDQSVRMQKGLTKYTLISAWDQVTDHIIWCVRSYKKYGYEIEMAMHAARSDMVRVSVERSIKILIEVIQQLLVTHEGMNQVEWLDKISNHAANTQKVYFKYLPDKPTFKSLIIAGPGRNFTRSVVLMHDLVQVAWSALTMPRNERPLAGTIHVQTGESKMEVLSSMTQMGTASKYAKKLGMPVEYGPSNTTVRICRINNLRLWAKSEGAHLVQPELKREERQHLVWAIFAYWTLFYPKSYDMAHNFHFVNNSAENLGCGLAPVNSYPGIDLIRRRLNSRWTRQDDDILSWRLWALQQGIDQNAVLAA